jgi:lipopolysaccharide/colanic/teichoic acid biosynthesis glycosyltransferase
MRKRITKISPYNSSLLKRLFDVFFSVIILVVFLPIFVLISFAVLLTSGWPFLFIQKRIGKNGKVFKIIKFRSMINGASKLQNKYIRLNESDGPTYKIKNDPRFTKIGRILSKSGLDELPQFINVIKGDMSIVGPRPLPTNEAKKINIKGKIRELIRPGITSPWVVGGSHRLTFNKWMDLDRDYVMNSTFGRDLQIVFYTTLLIPKIVVGKLKKWVMLIVL